ncbi:2OG-Fe(II) oxygenase [Achromobacter sp. HZ01]|uniref:2OG-Fe(II) oxygenase n=1 Tax=Achromobacter sp. HZ01 TaxID=1416886 RepID=UPI000DD01011|nr:2OG-Fe(II) oxygenase [Achromobacter sp. HZ01]
MTRADAVQAELPLHAADGPAPRIELAGSAPAIDALDWDAIAAQLDAQGYALLPGWLAPPQARALRAATAGLRRTDLAREDLGLGERYVFAAEPPAPLAAWREALYRHLVPIANRWNARMDCAQRYPDELAQFLHRGRRAGQSRALSCLNLLRTDGYMALQRHDAGAHVFPLQCIALLSEPDEEFTGGEFVMTEQRPRMQTRPMVLPLRLGDAALIATAQRPVSGARGDYRVSLKHAISRVRSGERAGLELLFHDAP